MNLGYCNSLEAVCVQSYEWLLADYALQLWPKLLSLSLCVSLEPDSPLLVL